MSSVDKALVRKRFGKAAMHYDRAALPQVRIADILADKLSTVLHEQGHRPIRKVLEIGCGTGLFSFRMAELLGRKGITYHFNDLSPDVAEELSKKMIGCPYLFQAYDAEQEQWGLGFDLIASSSCIQWWHQPVSFIGKAYTSLLPGGLLSLSTFLPGNLHEIHSILPRQLAYPTEKELQGGLDRYGFTYHEVQKEIITLSFDSLFALLRHLKETGTNALGSDQRVWTPRMITRMEDTLRATLGLSSSDSLPLTYEAVIVTAVK